MSTGSASTPLTVISVGHRLNVNLRTTPVRRSATTMVYRFERIPETFVLVGLLSKDQAQKSAADHTYRQQPGSILTFVEESFL